MLGIERNKRIEPRERDGATPKAVKKKSAHNPHCIKRFMPHVTCNSVFFVRSIQKCEIVYHMLRM